MSDDCIKFTEGSIKMVRTELCEHMQAARCWYCKTEKSIKQIDAVVETLKANCTLSSSMENFVEVNIKNVHERVDEIEKLFDAKKIRDCLFDGANTHLSILKLQTKIKELEYQGKKPHKCPVCDGDGVVELLCHEEITSPERYRNCHSCEGKGIIWG